ncbi:MAG TPA: type II secretion system F family protein [Roseiarcus sp.]|jgi:general secretion pathway protein F|nr:type II secretion system F family protein [Roseiarcus sp.]
MPTFQYRALSQVGELVTGSIEAPNLAAVNRRVEVLGLIPIGAEAARLSKPGRRRLVLPSLTKPKPEDVTIFTADLALLLRTGTRIDEALELLAADRDLGRMRSTTTALATSVLSGESFGEAVARHAAVFPKIYVALARVGETSGALAPTLEALAAERQRAEALSRRLVDTLRYPAFLLVAAGGVLLFFLLVVLPQFAGVFRDFQAKLDPVLVAFLGLSDLLRSQGQSIAATLLVVLLAGWIAARQRSVRRKAVEALGRLPLVGPIMDYRRTSLFCRNLGLLLSSGVTLAAALRILAEAMEASGGSGKWSNVVERVRHGGRLSDALAATAALPPMAVRTIRLGEDSSQLPMLAERIADFYETKLQRSLDHAIGMAGPVAIITISVIVGGLIVSVMTALLSVYQTVN